MQCKVCVVQSLHSGNKGGNCQLVPRRVSLFELQGRIDDKNPNQLLLHTIVNGDLKKNIGRQSKKIRPKPTPDELSCVSITSCLIFFVCCN